MTALFEVEARNRVVSGIGLYPITGTQGRWYHEKVFWLADSEEEAASSIKQEITKRRILGIPTGTRRSLNRIVEILSIRRIA
jgi:hypothetical protein